MIIRVAYKLILSLLCIFVFAGLWSPSFGQTGSSFAPPSEITMTVYELNPQNGARLTKCDSQNAYQFGCTQYCDATVAVECKQANLEIGDEEVDIVPYPFASPTITLGMESDIRTVVITGATETTMINAQLGYLHNVIPRETPPESVHSVAVAAQAIAARTYAYWQIDFNQTYGINPIDNSASGFQVYVPFAYDALEANNKQVVEDALADRFYISYASGPRVEDVFGKQFVREVDDPIFAEFNSESVGQTIDHPTNTASFPYMRSVANPISSHPTLEPTYQRHGFIQHGASRWAKGDVGWNLQLDREPWSVRWIYPAQILSHYYTDIHLRDADDSNQLVTPVYRWVPLRVEWEELGPDAVCNGESVKVTFTVQNTGTEPWDLNGSFRFDYAIETIPGGPSVQGQVTSNDAVIEPGELYTPTLTIPAARIGPVGTTKLVVFDMVRGTAGPFRNLESASNRPWYDFAEDLRVMECHHAYLPLVQGGASTAVGQ